MKELLNIDENVNVVNYVAEIKSEIEPYIYLTGTELAEARTDINKIFNKYDKQRKDITRELTKYIKDQMEPLIRLKDNADIAHEVDEKARKHAKLVEIMKYFKEHYAQYIPQWQLINNDKWLNKTVDEAKWSEDIDNKIKTIESDLKIVEKLGFDKDDYLIDIDLDRLILDNEQEIEVIVENVAPAAAVEPVKVDGVKRYTFNVVIDNAKHAQLVSFLNDNEFVWTVE